MSVKPTVIAFLKNTTYRFRQVLRDLKGASVISGKAELIDLMSQDEALLFFSANN